MLHISSAMCLLKLSSVVCFYWFIVQRYNNYLKLPKIFRTFFQFKQYLTLSSLNYVLFFNMLYASITVSNSLHRYSLSAVNSCLPLGIRTLFIILIARSYVSYSVISFLFIMIMNFTKPNKFVCI